MIRTTTPTHSSDFGNPTTQDAHMEANVFEDIQGQTRSDMDTSVPIQVVLPDATTSGLVQLRCSPSAILN